MSYRRGGDLMIYDKLTVTLLGTLATERSDSTNAHIARYLLAHQDSLPDLSIKALASACQVGTGSVSRFCREVGFESFEELRHAYGSSERSFEALAPAPGAQTLAERIGASIEAAAASVDHAALGRLADDLLSHDRISAYGMLKAQAAAVDLQVDLLMQGIYVDTCVSHAEQLRRIAQAGRDELIVVFSYTGSYFDSRDLSEAMRKVERPKIWVVCGRRHQLPPFVADRLLFSSTGSQLGHPYQLEVVAGMVAQECAARLAGAQAHRQGSWSS